MGLPYHRMAHAGRHAWWRPLVGTVLLLVLACVLLVLVMTVLVGLAALSGVEVSLDEEWMFSDPTWEEASVLATIATLLPATLLAAWIVRGRRGTVSSVAFRLRWGWFARCLLLALPGVLLAFAGLLTLETAFPSTVAQGEEPGAWVGWPRFLAGSAVVLVLVPLQSAAEEYLVRGWLPQTVGAYLRSPWWGIVTGALVFALIHGLSEPTGFVDLVFFGLVFGWLTVRTGGLEAAVAYHTTSNVIVYLVTAALGGIGAYGDTTAADADWRLPVAEAVVLPMYAAVVVWWHRGTRQQRYATPPVLPAVGPQDGFGIQMGQPVPRQVD